MKKAFSAKNIFLKILLPIYGATLFSTCDLLQETPKDFLEDYGSIAQIKSVSLSVPTTSQGAWQNVASDKDLTITYLVDNPGNHRLRASVSFSGSLNASDCDFDFPENDGLLRSVTKLEDDGAGNITQTLQPETETDFLISTFSIKIPQDSLAGIDGKVSLFNISPTVTLYRADFGEEERMQSLHTIPLRCNTPPAKIDAAIGQMIETMGGGTGDVQTLVLAIKLPALKDDDKYLYVSENGRTHTFLAHFADGDSSTDGSWTISSSAPSGMKATYDGGKEHTDISANCFIITDIDIKGRSPFGITLTLTDEGGLSSSFAFTSHGQKLLPPEPDSPNTAFDTSESEGLATYTLKAESGATIHYTATQKSGGTAVYSGSGVSPLAIKLPAGKFEISAVAKKAGLVDSDPFTKEITINPSVFFVSANGSDTQGDGSKSKPFATIGNANSTAVSLSAANPIKIFLLSDLELQPNGTSYNNMVLQGCAGGNKGSRVTISINFETGNTTALLLGGSVEMHDLNITQASSSAVLASGISFAGTDATLSLKNVSITGLKTTDGAVVLETDLTLNILGGVKITGNTSGGSPKNLYLSDGVRFKLQSGSLAGTQIGVSTEKKPADATGSIKITDGYGSAKSGTSGFGWIASDEEGYGFKEIGDEVALVLAGSGGTITPPSPPTNITFSLDSNSGDGNAITVSAFADGTPITDMTKFTNFHAEVWLGSVGPLISLGTDGRINLKTNNTFSFNSSWDSGIYTIKIYATYADTEFSDTLKYEYTKTP